MKFQLAHKVARNHLQKESAALGTLIAQPLKNWLERMYANINLVNSFDEFYLWMQDFRKVREVQRASGVPYDVALHWSVALEETPMSIFSAAESEIKDWTAIFLAAEDNPQKFREFWTWAANPFEVRLWLGNVFRVFQNSIFGEHTQMVKDQFNPNAPEELPEEEAPAETKPKKSPEPPSPENWFEEEELARRR